MPAKNALKLYLEHGYYHLYNRGVARDEIFLDEQDYAVFLSYLKEYLSPPALDRVPQESINEEYKRKNFSDEINLVAYCLMPNHLHLLVSQLEPRSIEGFTRALLGRYASYFNKRHGRVGHLFQGVYKGILIENEVYLLWLSRYIHRNPMGILRRGCLISSYNYSSYPAYLGKENHCWLKPEVILSLVKSYEDFVEQTENERPLQELTLE